MKSYEIQQNLDAMQALAEDINRWAKDKGFWNTTFGVVLPTEQEAEFSLLKKSQKLMLIVSELSECLEGLRKPANPIEAIQDPDGIFLSNEEEEIADAIIRLLDYAGQYNLRIGAAIDAKMAKNEGRPFMHGKKF